MKSEPKDEFERGVEEVREAIIAVISISKRTRQQLEREMDLAAGYLSKLLHGGVELKVRHIMELSAVLDFPASEFFRLAEQRRKDPGARYTIEQIEEVRRRVLRERRSSDAPIDEQVRESVYRLLQELSLPPRT
jgi:transcriptional regulator with XRE-family HTH domain